MLTRAMAASSSDTHYPLGAATCFGAPLEVSPPASGGLPAPVAACETLTSPCASSRAALRRAADAPAQRHRHSRVLPPLRAALRAAVRQIRAPVRPPRVHRTTATERRSRCFAPLPRSGSAEGVSRLTLAFITFGFWLQLWNLVVLHYDQLQLCFAPSSEPSLAAGAWVRAHTAPPRALARSASARRSRPPPDRALSKPHAPRFWNPPTPRAAAFKS